MINSKLLEQISKKDSNKETVAARIIKNPELLFEIFEGLNSEKAGIKYGCDKILRIISETSPSILYSRFEYFCKQLNNENNFLKWGAIHIIANLACVDTEDKFSSILENYFAPIPGPVMITASNIAKNSAKIALEKPQLTERITKELLKVEKAKYQTNECRNIVIGQAIKSFDTFFDQIQDKDTVIKFVKRQLKNTRNATRNKAAGFLKKHKYGKKEVYEFTS